MSKTYLVQLRKLQELLHLGKIHMNPIDTKENIADLFTKPLGDSPFWYLSHQIMGDTDEQFSPILRGVGHEWTKRNGGGVRVRREAPKSRISVLQALMLQTEEVGEDESMILAMDIPKSTSTCTGEVSICSFYGNWHDQSVDWKLRANSVARDD